MTVSEVVDIFNCEAQDLNAGGWIQATYHGRTRVFVSTEVEFCHNFAAILGSTHSL